MRDRFREFRRVVNEAYTRLYEEGVFSARKRTKPAIPAGGLCAIFLAGYKPETYSLYKATEYIKFAEGLGAPVPGGAVEDRYGLFVELSLFIKEYAKKKKGFP